VEFNLWNAMILLSYKEYYGEKTESIPILPSQNDGNRSKIVKICFFGEKTESIPILPSQNDGNRSKIVKIRFSM
jgi:hypothetical protein